MTRAPLSAARRAAAKPAGPAPITAMSQSRIGSHVHLRLAGNLTTPAVRAAIDGDTALKADSHPTERCARLTAHGPSEHADSRRHDRRGNHAPLWNPYP